MLSIKIQTLTTKGWVTIETTPLWDIVYAISLKHLLHKKYNHTTRLIFTR